MAQKRASTSELQGNLYKVSKGSILGISSRKVFAVCDGTSLSVWRTEHERIKGELPIKHVPVEPHTRVEDTGLQRITERKQLYTFALHYSSVRLSLLALFIINIIISFRSLFPWTNKPREASTHVMGGITARACGMEEPLLEIFFF